MKYWEIIANNLSKAGFSWGCVSTINSRGQTIFAADANRDDGNRFVVHADDKLTAFVELERAIHEFRGGFALVNHFGIAGGRAKAKRLCCEKLG